jgi:hypothetical protein
VTNQLTPEVVHRLAKLGAQARLEQIEGERRAILDMFPDLAPAQRGRRPGRPATAPESHVAAAKPARKRSRMSAAARKAVSERMRKYWADRRKAKGKEKA